MKAIPWFVQHDNGSGYASPKWDVVEASTSLEAAQVWLAETGLANYPLPMKVLVAPASPLLHHPNGMPMMSRGFTVTAGGES